MTRPAFVPAARTAEQNTWGWEVTVETVLSAPCKIYAERPRLAGDLLREGRRRPDETYLVQGERRLSFAEHEAAVAALRSRLESAGAGTGECVLILGANAIELVVTFWAVLRSGAVAVMGNAWWSQAELESAVDLVRPRIVVCDAKREALVGRSRPRLSYDEVRETTPSSPRQLDRPSAQLTEDAEAVVIFTSGTTGHARAAVLSGRGIVAGVQNLLVVSRRLPGQARVAPPSVSLLSLPLFHIGGLQQILVAMATGGTLVFSEGRFSAAETVAVLQRENVKVWSAVPAMLSRVVAYLEATGGEVPSLRTLGIGGAAVSEGLRERARAAFPQARSGIGVTWGLTEAGGAVTTGVGPEVEARPGCVGRMLPTSEVRVAGRGEDGTGELLVRSPSVMLRYHGTGDSPIDEDRWLRSGDIGRVDADGYVYVTDRLKDVIIRGGENIAARRVEDEISALPEVAEVAVIGLPDEVLGELVGAVLVLKPGCALDPDAMSRILRIRLAHFEVPSQWWVYPGELPKNATGKVMKSALRDEWTASDEWRRGTSGSA
jgi:long-chain acyl-CoA synthetase